MDPIDIVTTDSTAIPAPSPAAVPEDMTATYAATTTDWSTGISVSDSTGATITYRPPRPGPTPTPSLISETFAYTPAKAASGAEAKTDAAIPLRLVAVGWSGNGRYYSRELLQRKSALWKEGAKMYLEHKDRDIRDLAGALVRDSYYDEHGAWGPGIYGEAALLPDYREMLKARQHLAGTSITAMGTFEPGTAEGRKGDIVTDLVQGLTCDFVAEPAAGGRYSIAESLNHIMTDTDPLREAQETIGRLTAENAALAESLQAAAEITTDLRQEVARLKAAALVAEHIGGTDLPDAARDRIQTTILADLPLVDGELDEAALGTLLDDQVAEMQAFIEAVTPAPASPVQAMGQPPEPAQGSLQQAFAESFRRQGMSDEEADRMAAIAAQDR